jgi:flavin reductase (DIM6/NTAB) family NADH-FMN oxidoreductase RutF
MHLDLQAILGLDKRYRTTLINSMSGYRSVHLCGTKNEEGTGNLAVLNSVIHLGSHPPLLGMMLRPEAAQQHTLQNIRSNRLYTLNQMPQNFVAQVHQTSARFDGSEFESCSLNEAYLNGFSAPFVAESPVKYGLRLIDEMHIPANGTFLLVGEIQDIYIEDQLIKPDGFVALHEAGLLACSGLDAYYSANPVARFAYAKPDIQPTKIG